MIALANLIRMPKACEEYTAFLTVHCLYSVSGEKKETKMFFCNISYKTPAILMKFGTQFLE